MGCSGSAAGNAGGPKGKKFDDNKILKDAGEEVLTKPQLTAFNAWFNCVVAVCKAQEGVDPSSQMDCLEESHSPIQKAVFDRVDEDSDDKLNQQECMNFLKEILGQASPLCTEELMGNWYRSMACLDATSGDQLVFADFQRSKKILKCWLNSEKGAAAFAPPAPAAASKTASKAGEPAEQAAAQDAVVNDVQ